MNATSIVAWTLLHFVWQGALVAAALALVLAAMRRQAAQRRYVVSVVALAVIASLPVVTAARLANAPQGEAVLLQPRDVAQPGIATIDDVSRAIPVKATDPAPAMPDAGTRVTDGNPAGRSWTERLVSRSLDRLRAWGDRFAPFLVVVWLTGVLLLSLRLLGGWRRVRRLTSRGTRPASSAATDRLATIAAGLGVTRTVRLVESAMVQVPAVVGWLRPVLLLPLSMGTALSVRDLELLFAHELAHIRRHDYFINVLQTIVETALFYHPAIWWVSRQIREEREHCCDDIAVAFCGDTRAYAEALVRLEGLRQPEPLLAAAANGGSLLRRVRRLIEDRTNPSDGRARWTALPLAAAALAGIISGTRLDAAPGPVMPSMIAGITTELQGAQQRSNARPDTVIRYAGQGTSLGSRIEWARTTARNDRRGTYWIGYAIAADPDRGFIYMNRHVPVRTTDGSMFTGSMRFTSAQGLIISGVPLDSLIGPRKVAETIILVGYRVENGSATLDRLQLSSGMLPVHFDGRALYWVGDAVDDESIAQMRHLFSEVRSRELKNGVITTTAAHVDAQVVLAQLRTWLASNDTEDVRARVAEELSQVPLPAAVGLLARTARADRSILVRREAAEALGETQVAGASDTLVRLVNTVDETSVVQEAIEALGERRDPTAFDALVRIVWEEHPLELQREAVESMGESHDERRVVEVERIALTHRKSEIRREAVETLGELDDAASAIRVLRDVINQDAMREVREEAVETLADLDDARAYPLLVELARSHRDVEVRKAAVSRLADSERSDEALTVLREMIQDPTESVARSGIEALGSMEDARIIPLLETTAMRHASRDVQREAVSALGNAAPVDSALHALERIALSHPSEEIQRSAVEEFGNDEHQDVVVTFLERILNTHERPGVRVAAVEELGDIEGPRARSLLERMAREGRDEALQLAAIESYAESVTAREAVAVLASIVRSGSSAAQERALEELADLDEHAGVPTMIEVARSHPDLAIRRRAIEHLGDSDDPRAHAELARLLNR